MHRRSLCAAAAGLVSLSWQSLAVAQLSDKRPISIVVPFAPGGGSDILARVIGPYLAEALGVPFVVENRPGGGGTVAAAQIGRLKGDARSLLLTDMGFTANASVYAQPGYDPTADFEPVGAFASVASILIVRADAPYKNLQDLIAAGRARPNALNMASGGAGGTAHLLGTVFANEARFVATHVPYRGMAPAVTDVLSGQVDFIVATAPTALPNVQAGRARALAVTGEARLPSLEQTPTFSEQGLKNIDGDNVYGLVAPAKTDSALLRQIHDALKGIVQKPEVRTRFATVAAMPFSLPSSAAFGSFLSKEVARWKQVVKDNKITSA